MYHQRVHTSVTFPFSSRGGADALVLVSLPVLPPSFVSLAGKVSTVLPSAPFPAEAAAIVEEEEEAEGEETIGSTAERCFAFLCAVAASTEANCRAGEQRAHSKEGSTAAAAEEEEESVETSAGGGGEGAIGSIYMHRKSTCTISNAGLSVYVLAILVIIMNAVRQDNKGGHTRGRCKLRQC